MFLISKQQLTRCCKKLKINKADQKTATDEGTTEGDEQIEEYVEFSKDKFVMLGILMK